MEFTKTRYLVAVWGILSGDPEEDICLYDLGVFYVYTIRKQQKDKIPV